jgi:hypothetical protein
VFANWSPPCSGNGPTCTINLVSSVWVKAAFNPVSLSVRTDGGGDVEFLDNRPSCGSYCRQYNYDSTAHVHATAGSEFEFSSWLGCTTPSGPTCAVRMDANRIVTARFDCPGPTCSQVFPVTHPIKVEVQIVGHGRVFGSRFNCTQRCTRDVERGSTISVQAKADAGSRFAGWSMRAVTCSSYAEGCTFPVFKDATGHYPLLVASFKAQPPPPPPPPPSAPPVRCRVPKVNGFLLGRAKARIRSRHCSVGSIRRRASKKSLRKRVVAQRPRAGAVRRRGFPVNLVVGRRPR